MRRKAVLEGEWWILYVDGERIGPVLKATPAEMQTDDDKKEGEL